MNSISKLQKIPNGIQFEGEFGFRIKEKVNFLLNITISQNIWLYTITLYQGFQKWRVLQSMSIIDYLKPYLQHSFSPYITQLAQIFALLQRATTKRAEKASSL